GSWQQSARRRAHNLVVGRQMSVVTATTPAPRDRVSAVCWNSLIFHYRGCWGSAGVYTLKTIPSDVIAALDYLSSGKFPQVDSSQLFLIGHSLGGWAAVLVGASDNRVGGVIAIAPLATPEEIQITNDDAAQMYCPWLPGLSPVNLVTQWNELDSEFMPTEQVEKISPKSLLILHGSNDELIPVSQSEALYARAREPREIIIYPEANHSFVWHRQWLQSTVVEWLHNRILC
ncbi:MAG: prolyl oligopeptidase family serine peptidase, partial [Anaerolineaceae bacterium]|nr:prolyl oligopeptidase family serine peptidase [Anaerolineaceae bacterium]